MNNTIKAQFFAQYLGQTMVSEFKEYEGGNEYNHGSLQGEFVGLLIDEYYIKKHHGQYASNDDNKPYLLLRTIEQLTDEEVINITRLFDLSDEQIADTDLKEWIEALFSEPAGYCIDGYTGNQLLSAIFYMQSIGIILPHIYLNEQNKPKTLIPSALIEMGWVKIVEK